MTADQAKRIVQNSPAADDGLSRTDLVAATAAWLGDRFAAEGILLDQPVSDTLAGLYTDAYLVGTASAHAVTGDGQNDGRSRFGDWTPGDTEAARQRIEELAATAGLAATLALVPDAARSIAAGRLKDAARALIDSVDDSAGGGGTHADLADATAMWMNRLADPIRGAERAAGVAITQAVTAAGAAAMFVYRQQGVELGRWVVDPGSNVCALCQANADAGPVPIGWAYPSGHTDTPAHPGCRCAVVPSDSASAGMSGVTPGLATDEATLADEVGVASSDVAGTEAISAETSLADHVATGVADETVLGGGMSAQTTLVTFNDGARAVEKVAKAYAERPPDEATDAEALAAKLGREIGTRLPEVVRTADNTVYVAYVADAETGMEKGLTGSALADLADTAEGRRLGLFDLAVGNTDRNDGNWMVDSTGGLWGIDHGWAFNEFPTGQGMAIITARNPFAGGLIQVDYDTYEVQGGTRAFSVADIDHVRAALGRLEDDFTALGRQDWYQQTIDRLGWLAQHASGEGALFG